MFDNVILIVCVGGYLYLITSSSKADSKTASSIKSSNSPASIKYSQYPDSIKDSNPESSSYSNYLEYYWNDEHMLYMVIPKVHFDKPFYVRTEFKPNSIKNIVKMGKRENIDKDEFFLRQGKIFFLNYYTIL